MNLFIATSSRPGFVVLVVRGALSCGSEVWLVVAVELSRLAGFVHRAVEFAPLVPRTKNTSLAAPCARRPDFETGPYAAVMFSVTNERFEELASEALASLPDELSSQMDNVVIMVENQAPGRNLYGLYEGIPLTKRGPISYSGVMPDRITLYQTTICQGCSNEEEVRAQIRKTVIHEVAHHFGISDPRLDELGWA